MMKTLRIGTRGSPLALVQARTVQNLLLKTHPGLEVTIQEIRTTGDWKPEQGETLLSEQAGGKAQFAVEIETALLQNTVDIGVHSAKDMDSILPAGLVMDIFLPREDVRDCLFINDNARDPGALFNLKQGAVIGTSSPRRAAFLMHKRPDLKIVPLRGNVQTRLDKLKAGQVDATILALAGLKRLGISPGDIIDVGDFLPAAGQGAIGIEYKAENKVLREMLTALNHPETGQCLAAERAAVKALEGSCRSPIGALAQVKNGMMTLRLSIASLDGTFYHEDTATAPASEGEDLGTKLVLALKAKGLA